MMSEKKNNILVFIPLSPTSRWKGEGIAQTVENIIRYSAATKFSLVIGKHVEAEVRRALEPEIEAKRLELITIGYCKSRLEEGDRFRRLRQVYFQFNLICFIAKQWIRKITKTSKHSATFVPVPVFAIMASIFSKKLIVSFWDPFVFEYPHGYGYGFRTSILKLMKYALHSATKIITQSNVNKDYLTNFFGISIEKVRVIKNGYPDYSVYIKEQEITIENVNALWGHLDEPSQKSRFLTYLDCFFQKKSRACLQQDLKRAVLHRLVIRDNDKNTKIIMISTQNRPYKGFDSLFAVLDLLITKYRAEYRFKLISTGIVPKTLYQKYSWASSLVFELTRLDDYQHAYAYKISDLVIHPSFVEGGMGTYAMFEAASIGVPCLSNMGRHMLEFQGLSESDRATLCIDLIDKEKSMDKIFSMLSDKELREKNVALTNSLRVSWNDSGKKYEDLFLEVIS
jgi:glycosyltransferase involved in cell wall biosynthesis